MTDPLLEKARQAYSFGRLAAQHVDPDEGGQPPDAGTSAAMSRCVFMLGELIRRLESVEERPGYVPEAERPRYGLRDLQPTGMLWLINKSTFHPLGFALALEGTRRPDGKLDPREPVVWTMLGDGTESWAMGDDAAEFTRAHRFLDGMRRRLPDHPPDL